MAVSAGLSGSADCQRQLVKEPPVTAGPELGVPCLTGLPTAAATSSVVSRSQAAVSSLPSLAPWLAPWLAVALAVAPWVSLWVTPLASADAPLSEPSPPHEVTAVATTRTRGARARRMVTAGCYVGQRGRAAALARQVPRVLCRVRHAQSRGSATVLP